MAQCLIAGLGGNSNCTMKTVKHEREMSGKCHVAKRCLVIPRSVSTASTENALLQVAGRQKDQARHYPL